jgi:AP-1-like transcription factor
MASTGTLPPNFFLTPQQQNLLFAALNSNKQTQGSPSNATMSLSPTSIQQSPQQKDGYQESPYLDNYDYDFGPDSSFDFDFTNQPKMIGDIPSTANSDTTDNEDGAKRSHPDDDDDNSTENGGGNKRRESTEKVAKKPGRKPLTSEPSSVCLTLNLCKARLRLTTSSPIRNERPRIEPLSELSVSGRKSILKILRPRWRS